MELGDQSKVSFVGLLLVNRARERKRGRKKTPPPHTHSSPPIKEVCNRFYAKTTLNWSPSTSMAQTHFQKNVRSWTKEL
jgi:hypothetical protein